MKEATLSELQARVKHFVEEREWRSFHNPKNLAISIAIEAAELMEHFQWLTNEQSQERLRDPDKRAEVAAEVADVLIYALSFAEATNIDLTEAILTKLARNEQRFPKAVVRGKLGQGAGGSHKLPKSAVTEITN
ncbi:MAG: nucleotide pyrophosphohydrolase [Ardenticatenaceae bacterium]